jgi:class 3 adenylate cyclase
MLLENNTPLIIDCLSCSAGCNGGLGTGNYGMPLDRLENKVEKRMTEHIKQGQHMLSDKVSGGKDFGCAGIEDLINRYWKKNLYKRVYQDKSNLMDDHKIPNDDELKSIYERMKKRRGSDFLNCAACGYGSCNGMAEAVFNNLNRPENCHQYLSIELELRNRLLHETFGRYLSDDIVSSLLDKSDIQLGGTKRNITVLMSDIRGFTSLSESINVDKVVAMLNHYFTLMVEHVQRHRGTIIEFVGDGILAIFGAPVETPNHAEDAVACAVAMQNSMDSVNVWNRENGLPAISMGIGINTGPCIVGNIGSDKTMRYNVIGSNVNLCGRIETYTAGGDIYISDETRKSVKTELTISHTEKVHPKGLPNPISIYKIEGIGDPYNLKKTVKESRMITLKAPIPIFCNTIDEKYVSDNEQKCMLMAVSENSAIIVCRSMNTLQNIQIRIDGDETKITGKVTKEIKQFCYLVSITANADFIFNKTVKNKMIGEGV